MLTEFIKVFENLYPNYPMMWIELFRDGSGAIYGKNWNEPERIELTFNRVEEINDWIQAIKDESK